VFPDAAGMGSVKAGGTADWLSKAARRAGGARSLLAAAVSSDGAYLAVGGGDRKVHVWDVRSRQHVQVGAQTLFTVKYFRSVENCGWWPMSLMCCLYQAVPRSRRSLMSV